MPNIQNNDERAICVVGAHAIADLVRQKPNAVLGLATGSSPTEVYRELVRLHRQEGLSFRHVTTFNLDEYWPMGPRDVPSCQRYIREHFLDHVDIDPANTHVPDGTLAREDVECYCAAYEKKIEVAGGIDLQVLGIGRNSHIAFNEPGSPFDSRTRLVSLTAETRRQNARLFPEGFSVPAEGITMGLATIMEARQIVLLAFGAAKAVALRDALVGPVSTTCPASVLQRHPKVFVGADRAARALMAGRDEDIAGSSFAMFCRQAGF